MSAGRAALGWLLPFVLAQPLYAGEPPNTQRARVDYMLNCQGCHLPDGDGAGDVPRMKNFVGNFLKVPGGRAFLVQVPGFRQRRAGRCAACGAAELDARRDQPRPATRRFPPLLGGGSPRIPSHATARRAEDPRTTDTEDRRAIAARSGVVESGPQDDRRRAVIDR